MKPITTNQKILAGALVALLLGGTAGAFISRSSKAGSASDAPAATVVDSSAARTDDAAANVQSQNLARAATAAAPLDPRMAMTAREQAAYRAGFDEGFDKAQSRSVARYSESSRTVVYRDAPRHVARYSESPHYYGGREYRKPSFFQRHRDILTVAGGAGAGALIGGLVGHGKGAAIGALAGGGGAALYTYKLRKRHPRY